MSEPSPERRLDGGGTDALSMVLHEEQLRVGVQHVPTKRVRLRKYVVTEEVPMTLTLRHEVVEVIEEPLTGADAVAVAGPLTSGLDAGAGAGGASAEPAVVEMIVHREEPRVEVDVVATERIRLTRHLVTDHVDVTRAVAREHAEVVEEPSGVGADLRDVDDRR